MPRIFADKTQALTQQERIADAYAIQALARSCIRDAWQTASCRQRGVAVIGAAAPSRRQTRGIDYRAMVGVVQTGGLVG
jgi:hypothetical protein